MMAPYLWKLSWESIAEKSYERWVQGAKNRTVLFHYKNIITDLNQAHSCRALMNPLMIFIKIIKLR